MGGNTSKPKERPKTQLEKLGDKFPFSDNDFRTLIQCFQYTSKRRGDNTSFLVDLATVSDSIVTNKSSLMDINASGASRSVRSAKIEAMEKILPNGFSSRLESYCRNEIAPNDFNSKQEQDEYELDQFLNGIADCGKRGSRAALKAIHTCCSSEENKEAKDILDLCYRLALASDILALSTTEERLEELIGEDPQQLPSPTSLIESLTAHAKNHQPGAYHYDQFGNVSSNTDEKNEGISLSAFTAWSESVAPLIPSVINTFLHNLLFPRVTFSPSRTPFHYPDLQLREQHSALFERASSPFLFMFASMTSSLGGKWFRLYTTETDGLSFNRLQHSLLGYGGPTLMIIRDVANGAIFGAFTGSAWKESGSFYGNSDVFLYQLYPKVTVCRPRGMNGGTNYMYCNSYARSKGYDGLAHGIGFGGTTEEPRLFITETFDNCIASSRDLTFEHGGLLPPDPSTLKPQKHFEIESLEVWGVGGDDIVQEALNKRIQQRDIMQANIQKARKVDKAKFLDDFKSGLIESKAFAHREQMRGRDGGCELDAEEE